MAKKRTTADRRRAALLGIRRAKATARKRERVRGSWIRASKTVIQPGERVRISWESFGKSQTLGRVSVKARGYKDFFPEVTTGYTLTVRGYGQVSVRRVTVHVTKKPNREYFVVLIFKTRKAGKTITRRLYEAIITLPDGSSEEEVLQAYYKWLQTEHPELHNRDIEQLIFGPNAGRTIRIVPRDITTDQPAGAVLNDARRPRANKKPKGPKPSPMANKAPKRKRSQK